MKVKYSTIIIVIFISCLNNKQKQVTEINVAITDSIEIVKRPYVNSANITEYVIPVIKGTKIKHGIQKRFYRHGSLYSTIPYINGKKQGLTYTFYPVVAGVEPVVWKEQTYFNDNLNGICKRYHQNGTIQAEYEYKDGLAAVGLKEYNESGRPIPLPDLILTEKKTGAYFYITATMSNKTKNVDYYLGNLVDGKYMPEGLKGLQVREGLGELLVPEGTKSVTITAVYITRFQNKYIVSKTISF